MTLKDDDLEEELFCAICTDFYEDPLLLPCTHSFCRKCLIGRIEKGQVIRKSHSIFFDCPVCRDETILDGTGVDGLPRNRLLKRIVDKYVSKLDKPPTQRGSSEECSDHQKDLGAFCSTCRELVCIDCIVGEHKGHAMEAVDDVFKKRRKVLQRKLVELEQEKAHLAKAEQDEKTYLGQLTDSCKEKAVAIEMQFDEYIGLIQQSKDSVLEELQTREQEEMDKVEEVLGNIRSKKEEVDSCVQDLQKWLRMGKMALLREQRLEILKTERQLSDHGSVVQSPRSRCFLDCSLKLDNLNLEAAINNAHLEWEPQHERNSPKHLSEQFMDLYEKEWKSAYLECKVKNKDQVITHLLQIVMDAYTQAESLCEKFLDDTTKAMLQTNVDVKLDAFSICALSNFEDDVSLPLVHSGVKEGLRKLRAQYFPLIHAHKLEFLVHQELAEFTQTHEKMCSYAKRCFELCFWLQIQDPPMHITILEDKDSECSDTPQTNYKFVKRKGRKTAMIAWPALHLYRNGPLLAKGIQFIPQT